MEWIIKMNSNNELTKRLASKDLYEQAVQCFEDNYLIQLFTDNLNKILQL